MSDVNPDVKSLFFDAIEQKSPDELRGFLDRVCANDANLRAQLEQLLRAHRDAANFLGGATPATIDQPPLENLGAQIGPYKLLQQIDEGGMGVVYMAEQKEPVARRVALKIIKPGMDSQQVIARFEAERQALALMDHPNIAKVFDAGTTDSGRPYFVMELVNGIPVTEFCDQQHLTARERLELFIPICQAVQHAHQKGIIHRDLKPSNILIALYDSRPVPKVIDFGVAKAVRQKLTERTVFTGLGQIVGTLEYMSPEQAQPNQLDIDTRSDVYSLGVVLYELLTGETPFDKQRLRSSAWDEMLRIIREEEPPKPSTRLSSSEILASVAANRKIDPAKLSALVRGELDWIVMKALEKDRTRRYETASGLAADVQHFLDDEPVSACPPSRVYRFRKFARRNKLVLTASTLIALALAIGMSVATWQSWRATQARNMAEWQQARAERNFQRAMDAVEQMLSEVGGEKYLADIPQLAPIRRTLLEKALAFYEGLLEEEGDRAEVQGEMAMAHARCGDIHTTTGKLKDAEDAYRQAIATLDALPAEVRAHDQNRHTSSLAQLQLGTLLYQTGRYEDAEKALRAGLSLAAELAKEHPGQRGAGTDLGRIQTGLASALMRMGRRSEAQAMWLAGQETFELLTAAHPDDLQIMSDLAGVYNDQAAYLFLTSAGMEDTAKAFQRAEGIQKQLLQKAPHNAGYRDKFALTQRNLGTVLSRLNRNAEAEAHFREATRQYEKLMADFPTVKSYRLNLATCQSSLADLFAVVGKTQEAETNFHGAIELFRQLAEASPEVLRDRLVLAITYNNYGEFLANLGRLEEAEQSVRQALGIFQELVAKYGAAGRYDGLCSSTAQLAVLQHRAGRLQEAEQTFQGSLSLLSEFRQKDPANLQYINFLASYQFAFARLLCDLGRAGEAERLCRLALENLGQLPAKAGDLNSRINRAECSGILGCALRDQGRQEEAEACLREGLRVGQAVVSEDAERASYRRLVADIHRNLGLLLAVAGRTAEAESSFQQAVGQYEESIQRQPQVPISYESLARLLATCPLSSLRDAPRALTLAERAVQLAPNVRTCRQTLGIAQYRAGNWQAACDALEESRKRAAEQDVSDGFYLAMAEWQLGKKDEARGWYDQAVTWMQKNRPGDEELLRFRAEAAELLGIPVNPPAAKENPQPEPKVESGTPP